MALDELNVDAGSLRTRDKLIGVYIGILAVILAVCSLGGSNAEKDATMKNIEASNTWAFFQAKNARRQALRLHADAYEVKLQESPDLAADVRTLISAKIADYRAQDKLLTTDPARNEGLDELFEKGKALEAERDQALSRDPYFDYGQALLQIAIVLASVAIISGGNFLLFVSGTLGLLGTLCTFGGFTLAFPLPFAG
jgi:nitroreductase